MRNKVVKGKSGANVAAKLGLALLTGLVGLSSAQAQNVPTREEIQRDQLDRQLKTEGQAVAVESVERAAPCPLADPQFADLRFTLREARFTGVDAIDASILQPAFFELVGQQLSVASVCDIRDRASKILRDEGYLAAIQVPPQTIEDGTVSFDVVLARMTAVQVRGDAGPSEKALQKYIDKLVNQPVFNIDAAERYLLLARDIPGLDVRLTLRPASRETGGRPGDVVGEFNVERTPFYASAVVQNYGSRAVGRFGGQLRARINGLTGLGDETILTYYTTSDFDEQHVLQAGHEFRLGGEGFKLGGNFTYAWSNPGSPAPNGLETETSIGSVYASYPFIRKQRANLFGTIGLDIIDQETEFGGILINEDELRVAYARLDFNMIDQDSLQGRAGYTPYEPKLALAGSVEARQGIDIFGASSACTAAQITGGTCFRTRFDGDPTAFLIRAQAQLDVRPTPLLKLSAKPRLQYAPDALLSYEEISGGNYTVGRGFDPGSVIGDSGFGVTGEIAYGSLIPETPDGIAVQPYAFVDYVRIWQENYRLNEQRDLTSVGGGMRMTLGRQANLDAILAVPLNKLPLQTERNDVRFLIRLTAQLAPWYD